MAYSDFTLERVEDELGVGLGMADLFPRLSPVPIPTWLTETFHRYEGVPLISEKARDQLLVMPLLVAARELSQKVFTIFSGQAMDVDAEKELVGECGFILARTPPLPLLRAPVATIAQAKQGDIELSLGPCAAQMVGAQRFNEKRGDSTTTIYGCVTTGEHWQFLSLEGSRIGYDRRRYSISETGAILAVFQAMFAPPPS